MSRPRLWILLLLPILVVGVGFFVWRLTRPSAPSVNFTLDSTGSPTVVSTSSIFSDASAEEARRLADDQDYDQVSASDEKKAGTDPTKPDTDGDGFRDGEELGFLKTDPLKPQKGEEVMALVRAMPAGSYRDLWLETHAYLLESSRASTSSSSPEPTPVKTPVPGVPSGTADDDKDGLTLDQELQLGTDPSKSDTDNDGLTDGQEAKVYRTDPKKTDTDGDSYADGQEVKANYNPRGAGACINPGCLP